MTRDSMGGSGGDPRSSAVAAARELEGIARLDVPIGLLTTYKVGGVASVYAKVESLEQLRRVADVARHHSLPMVVIGRGSNMLVADAGFAGIAIQLGDFATQIGLPSLDDSGSDGELHVVRAGASVALPVLARRTAAVGLRGFEWAVGVPGSIGGAVRMNAGGHGSDMSETLVSCTLFDLCTGVVTECGVDTLGLRFRGSALVDNDVVVTADIGLRRGDARVAQDEIDEIVRWRRDNQPGGQNAGSVFVNPVPGEVAAGQLIDELGLRGFRIGTASVSTKHANFIQADDGGRADDVVAVMSHVRHEVESRFGYRLRTEVRLVGYQVEES